MIGQPGSNFVHPDEVERLRDNTAQFMLAGDPDFSRDRRYRIRLKDGGYRWHEGNPSPIRDGSGAVIGMLNVVRDVHEGVAAADALAASEARYRLLAEHMSDIVVKLDVEGRIEYVSP